MQSSLTMKFQHFINQKEILYPLAVALPPQLFSLSLWICLFRIFSLNGIIYYVAFNCLASHLAYKFFMRFIHVVACVGT